MLKTKRERRWIRERRLIPALAFASLLATAAFVTVWLVSAESGLVHRSVTARRSIPHAEPVKFSPSGTRSVYPYSVIRGGAYSRVELIRALDSDAPAARHYAVFERGQVRTTASPFSKPVYVSYRVGGEIYWTSRPISLGRGETLLTDGTHYARARCGNRISEKPQVPVNQTEPALSILDTAQPPREVPGLERWSENRLTTELAPPYARVVPLNHLPISAVPTPAPEGTATPPWWLIGAPGGFLYIGGTPDLSPPVAPASPGGPVIVPNPIPELTFPPVPPTGYPPILTTPGFPPTFPTAPPTVAWIPQFPPIPTGFPFPVGPEFPLVPEYPALPVIPGFPGFPETPGTPGIETVPTIPLQPVPEPSTLPVVLALLLAATGIGLRRQR